MRKQNPYRVRMVALASGERLPLLCVQSTGIPLFEPTLYALTELRARNLAAATIDAALRGIMVLYLTLDRLGVDLNSRLNASRFLEHGENEELVRSLRFPLAVLSLREPAMTKSLGKLKNLEKIRLAPAAQIPEEVRPSTAGLRLLYIRGYLVWLTDAKLLKLRHSNNKAGYTRLKVLADLVLKAMKERIPSGRSRSTVNEREGLSEGELARVLEAIGPDSPKNPFKNGHVRERNALIVLWLLKRGMRRGELLGIKVSDINFQGNEFLIARRADDPDDPRKYQPNAKTFDRLQPLEEEIAVLTRRYITGTRRSIRGARRHEFLFVATGTGRPMSLSGLYKIFVELKRKCPGLPVTLFPHIFRHTWNDRFSDEMDKKNVPEAEEIRIRSQLMGWKENSGTALIYTRRHVRRKAREASLGMQNKLKYESRE
jgi:integrase